MISCGSQIMSMVVREVWWKIAAKKAAETTIKIAASEAAKKAGKTAIRIATSGAAKKAAEIVSEEGIRKVFTEKDTRQPLGKRLKALKKMLKKGELRQSEYETLRKRVIEETGAGDL